MYRHRELLLSCLASAMLTAGLIPAPGELALAGVLDPAAINRAMGLLSPSAPEGFTAAAAQTPVAAPVQVAAGPRTAVMTPALLRSLLDAAATNPDITPVSAVVAAPLGLTPAGTPYQTRQAFYETTDGYLHCVAVNLGNTGNVMWSSYDRALGNGRIWVSDRAMNLLAAGIVESRVFRLTTVAEARPSFDAALSAWAQAFTSAPPQS
ncbi:MAG: hypothetical protein SF051_06870 [Elusimicrobiota bacterium]|nr:hypothetical protein [Elusimicrobiota bacterium]